jgi:Tol biopolymer transport system component
MSAPLCQMNTGKDTLVATEPVFRGNISPDGKKIAYELLPVESGAHLVDLATGESKRICDKCAVQKWMPDGSRVMYYARDPGLRFLLHDPSSGKEAVFLGKPIRGVNWIRFSNDMKWVSFHTIQSGRTRIHVAPYRGGEFPGEETWIPITEETDGHHYGSWSADGALLYFLSGRFPETTVLAQPLDPLTKKPRGKKFEVFRAPSGHAFAHVRVIGLSLAPGRMVMSMVESKGNLWVVEP